MHLARPADALREMLRILRPGGLLVCVEPNNLWNYLAFTSLTAQEPVDVLVRRFEFWLRYHRGKAAAGEGNHAIGDLLPGVFAKAGLTEIAVHLNDRAAAVFPPYDSAAQQALLAPGTAVEGLGYRPVGPCRTAPSRVGRWGDRGTIRARLYGADRAAPARTTGVRPLALFTRHLAGSTTWFPGVRGKRLNANTGEYLLIPLSSANGPRFPGPGCRGSRAAAL